MCPAGRRPETRCRIPRARACRTSRCGRHGPQHDAVVVEDTPSPATAGPWWSCRGWSYRQRGNPPVIPRCRRLCTCEAAALGPARQTIITRERILKRAAQPALRRFRQSVVHLPMPEVLVEHGDAELRAEDGRSEREHSSPIHPVKAPHHLRVEDPVLIAQWDRRRAGAPLRQHPALRSTENHCRFDQERGLRLHSLRKAQKRFLQLQR